MLLTALIGIWVELDQGGLQHRCQPETKEVYGPLSIHKRGAVITT